MIFINNEMIFFSNEMIFSKFKYQQIALFHKKMIVNV